MLENLSNSSSLIKFKMHLAADTGLSACFSLSQALKIKTLHIKITINSLLTTADSTSRHGGIRNSLLERKKTPLRHKSYYKVTSIGVIALRTH